MDSISLMSSRKKGFRWSSLPDLVLMSSRVQLFELNFREVQRKHIPRKRSLELTCLHDGYVDAVVTSWEAHHRPGHGHQTWNQIENSMDNMDNGYGNYKMLQDDITCGREFQRYSDFLTSSQPCRAFSCYRSVFRVTDSFSLPNVFF